VGDGNQAEVIDGPRLGDDAVTAAWRRLAELRENPFLTPEWFRAWLRANPAEEPFAIVWRVDSEVRGVLPLVRVAKGSIHLLRFAGARRGDWFTPACGIEDEPAMAVACGRLLRRERRAWQLLRLDRVDHDSTWPQALWAAGAKGSIAPARPRRTDSLPYIAFDGSGYDGYLAGRSRNFRSQLGRRRRKLEGEHGLCFRMTTDAEQLDADLETFFRLHEERWRDRGGSTSGSEGVMSFHREFAAGALAQGWLRLWIAEADGVPAAAWYGWRIGRRYCYSLSGLGKDYEDFALGTVLLAHTIEEAAAEGAEIYDMMWGDEAYKQRFETGRRDAATWVLGRRRHPAQLGAAVRTALEGRARGVRGD
jgi:CelD/BcsL family acetyltransferase involved in cellulose biosynthesis